MLKYHLQASTDAYKTAPAAWAFLFQNVDVLKAERVLKHNASSLFSRLK